jgi:anti-sigma-K factor RskA
MDGHLKVCATCREELAEYRQLGDAMLFATPLAPAPAALTEGLRKQLNAARVHTTRRRWGWLDLFRRPGFALGAVALALLVLTNVYWAGRVGSLEQQASEFSALTHAPGVRLTLSQTSGSGDEYVASYADGVVYVQPGSQVALLCVYALPPLEPGKTYQAWLVRDDRRDSAGTFNVNPDGYGVLLIQAEQPVSGYQQLGITVEPAGGSYAPTTPRVMGGTL